MTIGERLAEERLRLGFNQPDFAAIGGKTKKTQIEWEKGDAYPNAAFLAAIAAHGADVAYILTGNRSTPALRVEQERAGYSVEVLSKEEQALLDNYRHAPPDGRAALETTSAALAQSSNSKKRAG